jgi:tRNA (mo5U34)-methyltransferase
MEKKESAQYALDYLNNPPIFFQHAPWKDIFSSEWTEKVIIQDGNTKRWQKALSELPEIKLPQAELKNGASIGFSTPESTEDALEGALRQLIPWRKGPFHFGNVNIDTEWQSNLKWDRIKKHLNIKGKRVLDVGCGNGYYMYRMLENQPRWVLGLDPSSLFLHQFMAMHKYLPREDLFFYPAGIEALSAAHEVCDTIFCMGVLYHRPDPLGALKNLAQALEAGGELFLETMTIAGEGNHCLSPLPRYAQMRNVYFLPTDECLKNWLLQSGFSSVEILDISYTNTKEQRVSDWIFSKSLDDFLDPNNPELTIEGYPAPRRTLVRAIRKEYRK